MNEWAPVLAGFGIIAALLLAAWRLPYLGLRKSLLRAYGPKPSGAYALPTRTDLAKRAVASLTLCLFLLAAALAFFPLSEHFPNESNVRLILETYSLMAFLLSGVAALISVLAVLHIAFWRPRTLAMSRERLLDLANHLELMRRGELPYESWGTFTVVRFDNTIAEAIRSELTTRIGPRPRELSDLDAEWIASAVSQLLDQAV